MAGPLVEGLKKVWVRSIGRINRSRGQRRLELVETLNLGGKRQLMMVACDGRNYLIGMGGDSVQSIVSMCCAEVKEDSLSHGFAGSELSQKTVSLH
jgi:flagellar biogenesis protein FliO